MQRVVDGDTFVAQRDGRSVRVRLIGVDAPESVTPDRPVECGGPEAAAALRRLLPPTTWVSAAYEPGGRLDPHGRELWDVWLADGPFLQAELVRAGLVEARAYPPHVRYADLLDELEREARLAGRGLHGRCR
ncbi:MAG: thermonuclease family protein [Actinomycetota bacterium]|nr:thermonuclease family protein [Actinomycetota bacterium]